MAKNLTMPRLSDTMEVGTIVKWHVKPGQKVKAGDVVADIETDKATMELQTFEDGVVSATNVKEGQAVPVGTLILSWEGGAASAPAAATGGAMTAASSAAAPSAPAATVDVKPARVETPVAAQTTATSAIAGGGGNGRHTPSAPSQLVDDEGDRIFASPLARKMAADAGLDLSQIAGSGPSGRIVRQDVEDAIAGRGAVRATATPGARKGEDSVSSTAGTLVPARPEASAPSKAQQLASPLRAVATAAGGLVRRLWPVTNMRKAIAARLVESKTTIPHYQVTVTVRMDALLNLRQQLNDQLASQGVKLSVNDFIVRACALAMHQHPYVNTKWVGNAQGGGGGGPAIEFLETVNIGVAIALPVAPDGTGGGLVVATLRDADNMGLRQISAATKALADKARAKGLTLDEMADSTFTISNLGMFGVEDFTAIINPPNTAILAVGAAIKKPLVESKGGKDELVVGHEMQMTMSSDHRVIDGAMAAQYLATVKAMLEKPASVLV